MSKEQYVELTDSQVEYEEEALHYLVLHNDDVNTFDFVINSLVEVCQHDPLQAEQCAIMVHFNGSCEVLQGSLHELMPPYEALRDRELTVSID